MRWAVWPVLAWASSGCGASSPNPIETCSIDVVLAPVSAAAGDTVVATGGPMTETRDTLVQVGGLAAVVTAVERGETCEDCELCRRDADCAPCGFCPGQGLPDDQRLACFGDVLTDPVVEGSCDLCVETVEFIVPDGLPVGPATVVVFNANGQSPPIPLQVVATSATGKTPSTTTSDTGSR
jgi:hypothetical protein